MAIDVDGEVWEQTPCTFSVVPGALSVIAGPQDKNHGWTRPPPGREPSSLGGTESACDANRECELVHNY